MSVMVSLFFEGTQRLKNIFVWENFKKCLFWQFLSDDGEEGVAKNGGKNKFLSEVYIFFVWENLKKNERMGRRMQRKIEEKNPVT